MLLSKSKNVPQSSKVEGMRRKVPPEGCSSCELASARARSEHVEARAPEALRAQIARREGPRLRAAPKR